MIDVQQSLMGSRWVFTTPELQEVSEISRRYDLPEILARLLVARKIDRKQVDSFIAPTLKKDFPDPFSMSGMHEMAAYMADAIIEERKIAIFADFDVDGATSAALLYRFLRNFNIDAPVYIPDRHKEGYGPNRDAFAELKSEGAEIVVLCDCGTTAFQPVTEASDMGMEVVIFDHHETENNLPDARHVINPKRRDCNSGLEYLAAAGVTFLCCVAINNVLRNEKHFYDKGEFCEPDLRSMLDIAALGTVCDMVPLTGANRLIVRTGLQMMGRTKNPGLKALIDVSGLESSSDLGTYHAGFILGPRINAGSRVSVSKLGARLLCTDDKREATDIAWSLEDANNKRKSMQATMLKEAISRVDSCGLDKFHAIVVEGENWHSGLSGLVAGRLKEFYNKPSAVIAYVYRNDGVMEGRGSCRSVPGVNVAHVLIEARNEGLLTKAGGHAMAGGFTLNTSDIQSFREFFIEHVEEQLTIYEHESETLIDGVMTVKGLKPELAKMIEIKLGPFGEGNPEPVFALPNVRIYSANVVGDGHVRFFVSDWEGGPRVGAIAFRAAGTEMGRSLLKYGRQPFHLAGSMKINKWRGRENVEFHVIDAANAMAGEYERIYSP